MVSPAVRCEVIWDQDENPWAMNVLHLPPPVGPIGQAQADGVRDALTNALGTSGILPHISNTVRVRSVRLKDLRLISTDVWESTLFTLGTGGAGQIPDNVSLAVQLVTEPGSANGRVYQWGFDTDSNAASGRPNVAAIPATVALWADFDTSLPVFSQFEGLGVLSRTSNTLHLVTAVRRSPSSNAQGWQTQRRRSDGLSELF